MNTILTRDQREYYMRQKLPHQTRTDNPALLGRLKRAREQKSVSQALDALMDYVSTDGGMSGIDPKTYHWLREKRRDGTL